VGCRGGWQTTVQYRQTMRPIASSVRVRCKRGDWAGGSRGVCFPDGFWALGSRQPGGAKVFVGKIDSLAASSRKARRRSDQGHDLIPTDLPIADMGAPRAR